MNQSHLSCLDGILQRAVDEGQVVGLNAMVIQNGVEQYYGEAGLSDREAGTPMSRDRIFRIFSMTKPVTSAAAMILLERGELDLLAPVSKFLPGFEDQVVYNPVTNAFEKVLLPMTLKDLMGMLSGMPYGGPNGFVETRMQALFDDVVRLQKEGKETSTIDFANQMGQLPLLFQPGTKWQYGVSADVMGAVIEVISGKRFGEFLHDEIFKPLGMNDTGFWVPTEKRNRMTAAYEAQPDGSLERFTRGHLALLPEYDHEPAFQSGGAGLVSTIDDYAKFGKMLVNGGELNGTRILSRRIVQFMTSSQLTSEQQKSFNWDSVRGYGYGNFMRVLNNEGLCLTPGSLGEFGWDGWMGTYFCASPRDDMVLLMMMQRIGSNDVVRRFRSVAYTALD